MWYYIQRDGELIAPDGEIVAIGYSGFGEDKNRPESQDRKNFGPIPCGRYTIGPSRATQDHGPYVLRLTPDPSNMMRGRGGFLVHGDSMTRPGTASNGCIVLSRNERTRIWTSGDRDLTVLSDIPADERYLQG